VVRGWVSFSQKKNIYGNYTGKGQIPEAL